MSYQALYRKFRPDSFDEVRGQDVIVTTLKNQLSKDRIGHAYLFTGTRGTGKTSVAKLFAKAVNCSERREDGSPCGKCASCTAIKNGSSMNVIEIDAASNNSVDNIREIREEVQYRPTDAPYRVYIIDEAHMLSTSAFNALLKTLEEPPEYVIFILATTEVNKIPITVLSRCQRYDFRRMTIDTLVDRMKELSLAEGISAGDRALRYVAKCANGSMRDALSLLDRCAAFFMDEELTYDKVLTVLGAVDTSVFEKFLYGILNKDAAGSIALLEDAIMEGRDLSVFINDFTWYLRNLLLVLCQDENMEEILDVSSEALDTLKEAAKRTDPDTIMRFIRIFSALSAEIKYAADKRVLSEIAVIKLMRPESESDLSSVMQRLNDLERKLAEGIHFDTIAAPQQEASGKPKVIKRPPLPDALPEEIRAALKSWGKILSRLPVAQTAAAACLKEADLTIEGDTLVIAFDNGFDNRISQKEDQDVLSSVMDEVAGKHIKFTVVIKNDPDRFDETHPDLSELVRLDDVDQGYIEEGQEGSDDYF